MCFLWMELFFLLFSRKQRKIKDNKNRNKSQVKMQVFECVSYFYPLTHLTIFYRLLLLLRLLFIHHSTAALIKRIEKKSIAHKLAHSKIPVLWCCRFYALLLFYVYMILNVYVRVVYWLLLQHSDQLTLPSIRIYAFPFVPTKNRERERVRDSFLSV